jgi:hypothetical protein
LVSDSQSIIHEGIEQWKEEKSSNGNVYDVQNIYMTIPTENLGNINICLQRGPNGTRIIIKVDTEEVRKYLLENTAEIKSLISKNALITIDLNEKYDIDADIPGVDLWM